MYFKIVYRQDDMFRPSLGHPQALKENGSKTTQMFHNAFLWKIYVILDPFFLGSEDDPVKVETCRPDDKLF